MAWSALSSTQNRTSRHGSRLLRPLPLPQFDASLHRSIGYGLESFDLPLAPSAPREERRLSRFQVNADPALLLSQVGGWGPLALTTYTGLGRMTSIVEITRIDCEAERMVLRSGGSHALHLLRHQLMHCIAGTPSSRRGEGDWSFTINWSDASGQPLLDLAVLDPTRIARVTEALRPQVLKAIRGGAEAIVTTSTFWTPNEGLTSEATGTRLPRITLASVLESREHSDALCIDLASAAVRHRYIGPLTGRRIQGRELCVNGEGCSLQFAPQAVTESTLSQPTSGTPSARLMSKAGESLQVSPASGDEFAAWWLSRQTPRSASH